MSGEANREETIFERALGIDSLEGRQAYLREACGDDAALLDRLEGLLRAHDRAGRFLEHKESQVGRGVPAEPQTGSAPSENPGDHIGRYKLLEKIGEGGFGDVWMAEQEEPVRRRVALKIIKLGMDTRSVVARFEAERQALALMDHPNIARVYDGGATESGRPYFVMELVRGLPITKYCDETKMSTRERLELFGKVCRAVQHAHQKGIIHRDLKPSNILVTEQDGRAVPKVIDFGVAKATEGRLTDKTLFTGFQQLIGTPTYMSPEQAGLGSLDIDTRGDIYSLGVVLYELLTGHPPFDTKELLKSGYEAVLRTIREVDPPKPSTRLKQDQLAALGASAKSAFRAPHSAIDPDLDWIVMKCLEKDRNRRYETANGLATDLERYLHDEPVLARPPSRLYRWGKFARKHRTAVAAAAGLIVLLLAGTGVSLGLALWAHRERGRAEQTGHELRRRSYASDMNLAHQAIQANSLGRAKELLERNRPRAGESDLRHWEWRYLWPQSQSDALFVLTRHIKPVGSISFSPDGHFLAWGAEDGVAKVWDIPARKEAVSIQDRGPSSRVAFSPRGDLLAAAAPNGTVRMLHVHSWNVVMELRPAGGVQSMSFSTDGKRLAMFEADRRVSLHSLDRTNLIAAVQATSLSGEHKGVVAIAPNDQWLAVGETDGRIRVLELPNLTERLNFSGHAEGITALAFSPDNKTLASGSGYAGSSIRLWNTADGTSAGRLVGHSQWVKCLVFSPDGALLASAGADQTIRLWDRRSQSPLVVLRGHQHEVWALAFSPNGKTLASGGKDGEILIWSAETRQKESGLSIVEALIRTASFSPDGRKLATDQRDGSVRLWDVATLQESHHLTVLGTNNCGVLFSPARQLLAVGDERGVIKLLDPMKPGEQKKLLTSHGLPVLPIKFTADGEWLLSATRATPITGGASGRICALWAVDSGKELTTWLVPSDAYAFELSFDGRLAAIGDLLGYVRLWDTAARREAAVFEAHRSVVSGIAFSPDAESFATSSEYGEMKLWEVKTRECLATIRGNLWALHSVAFSPDGRRLITGCGGREAVRLWDVATRQELIALEGPGVVFKQLQFSPDGNSILAVDDTGILHLWHAPSFAQIAAAERTLPRAE